MDTILLSSTYLGPIDYYKQIVNKDKIVIEQYDYFEKQTYRNRCRISTSNQVLDLIIPIIRPKEKRPFKDIKISYTEKWQQAHWRAIESAYNKSPFFEYYKEDFEPFYTKKTDFLLDLNQNLMQIILDLLHIKAQVHLTEKYQTKEGLIKCKDLRDSISTKNIHSSTKPYYQVFNHKFGFIPNLSIIDLLFNMGNESIIYLNNYDSPI